MTTLRCALFALVLGGCAGLGEMRPTAPVADPASARVTPAAPANASAAVATRCKPAEVDDGDACHTRCEQDSDCAAGAKKTCGSMMVPNPNGGSSTALVCQ